MTPLIGFLIFVFIHCVSTYFLYFFIGKRLSKQAMRTEEIIVQIVRNNLDYYVETISSVKDELVTLEESVAKLHARIDAIFVVSEPVKNEVSEVDDNTIELSDASPLQVPKDLKFEVEGADEQTPPPFPTP